MHDTLKHLVTQTIHRPDASKFLYILNQIDTAAREDNLEDVSASWQRALAQKGLITGRFYRIYNPDAAATGIAIWTLWTGQWTGFSCSHPFWQWLLGAPIWYIVALVLVIGLGLYSHFTFRQWAAKQRIAKLQTAPQDPSDLDLIAGLPQAFRKNTCFWRSLFAKQPAGWNARSRWQIAEVLVERWRTEPSPPCRPLPNQHQKRYTVARRSTGF